jgi:hypothetical protein
MDMFERILRPDMAPDTHRLTLRGGSPTLVITLTTLVINAALLVYEIGYIQGWNALYVSTEHYDSAHGSWPYSIVALRLSFIIALAVSGAGLFSRTFRGFICSLIAWLSVVVGYTWWYYNSLQLLRKLEIVDYSQLHIPGLRHMGGLRQGTWWDMIFLASVVLVLVWHFWSLKALRKSKNQLI